MSVIFLQIALLSAFLFPSICADAVKARAYTLKANERNSAPFELLGIIDFTQFGGTLKINGTLSGLSPGLLGFHVHDKGDIGDGCKAAGPHFNPTNKSHGAPTDFERHVGDLGNIEASQAGVAHISIEDSLVSLHGPYSIIGRTIVVHERADDLGRGNTESSRTTGDSGARIACGVIGITEEAAHPLSSESSASPIQDQWHSLAIISSVFVPFIVFQ
uniref:Superoxide dismutase [Cu-Zn] n=1 Tax=Parascaris univalens TaxID=6257 RepID=A0A915BIK0_PARUN